MENLDPKTPVGDLFAGGPIEVVVASANGVQVKLGLNADPRFRILREELCPLKTKIPHRHSGSGNCSCVALPSHIPVGRVMTRIDFTRVPCAHPSATTFP